MQTYIVFEATLHHVTCLRRIALDVVRTITHVSQCKPSLYRACAGLIMQVNLNLEFCHGCAMAH